VLVHGSGRCNAPFFSFSLLSNELRAPRSGSPMLGVGGLPSSPCSALQVLRWSRSTTHGQLTRSAESDAWCFDSTAINLSNESPRRSRTSLWDCRPMYRVHFLLIMLFEHSNQSSELWLRYGLLFALEGKRHKPNFSDIDASWL
jgi:hypothetical protein